MSYIFRPQEFDVKPTQKNRYRGFQFLERPGDRWSHRPLNQQTLIRIHGRVHYLTEHAPAAVQARYENLRKVWNKKLNRKTESGMLKWL